MFALLPIVTVLIVYVISSVYRINFSVCASACDKQKMQSKYFNIYLIKY